MKNCFFVILWLAISLFGPVNISARQPWAADRQSKTISLGQYLNRNGHLQMPKGFKGNPDPREWHLDADIHSNRGGSAVSANTSSAWAQNGIGTSDDFGNSIAVDADGNSYVTGGFSSPSITFGSTTLSNHGWMNMFFVKYDASGNVLWAKSPGGTGFSYGNGITVDAGGNSYVVGMFNCPTITFGTITLTNTGSDNQDIFIVKYNAGGNVVWAKDAGGTGNDFAMSIALGASGSCYITGYYWSAGISFDGITLTNLGTQNIFVARYDPDGNALWATYAGGSDYDNANSIAVDGAGNCFVTGYVTSSTAFFGDTTIETIGGGNAYLAKYDPNGNVLWVSEAIGSQDDISNAVAVDGAGNSYATGYSTSPTLTIGSTTIANSGSICMYLIKYDAMGNVLWAVNKSGAGDEPAPSTVMVDNTGYIYVTGLLVSPSITFGSTTLTNAGVCDPYLVKYDANGEVVSAHNWGGTQNDWCNGSAIDATGNCYLIGEFISPSITFGSTTLANSGSMDLFVAKIRAENTLRLSYDAKWNLVSVPLTVKNYQKTSLFPTATSDAFSYAGSYSPQTTLHNGVGYWLKFGVPYSLSMNGTMLLNDTITVTEGWNLVGSISSPLPVATVTADPSGMTANGFYGYSNGYHLIDTLEPGLGYWVKVSQAGKIILSGLAPGENSMVAANSAKLRILSPGGQPPPPPADETTSITLSIPREFGLEQNYPNPFNPTTDIGFRISDIGFVSLKIFNTLGQEMATLVNEVKEPGVYHVQWNASGIPSGVYYYRLDAGPIADPTKRFMDQRKMLLVR